MALARKNSNTKDTNILKDLEWFLKKGTEADFELEDFYTKLRSGEVFEEKDIWRILTLCNDIFYFKQEGSRRSSMLGSKTG